MHFTWANSKPASHDFFFFNYTFFKITSFRTSSQRFSPHDCKFLLEPWKGCKEKTECQRFPCNHSYFLLWKLPIFVVSRERIAEDFYLCLKTDYVFLSLSSSDFKKKPLNNNNSKKKKKHKNNTYHPFCAYQRVCSALVPAWGNTAHGMLAFTVKCYKLKSNSGRILWGQLCLGRLIQGSPL